MMSRMRRGARDERGAVAIVAALLAVVIFGMAALAVDLSSLTMQRQQLHDTVDVAAHAGAYEMPGNGTTAKSMATSMARSADATLSPTNTAYCVIASTGAARQPLMTQVPSTCTPGGTVTAASGWSCNTVICAIPCVRSDAVCNTIKVAANKTVPYVFAPILGFGQGNTGSVVSAACKGSCGAESPNPMDVVVLADRTASLSDTERGSMVSAVKSMMLTMDPTMHYLSVGTIDKSAPTPACLSEPRTIPTGKTSSGYVVSPAWTAADLENPSHKWIPTDFSRDYVTGPSGSRVAKTTDPVYHAVDCIRGSVGEYGTHLSAPMKEAARKLLGLSDSNLDELTSAYPRPGQDVKIKKVLILETDGAPNEFVTSGTDSALSADVLSAGPELRNPDGNVACEELLKVAASAKSQDILVITIGFGEVVSAKCNRWNNFGGKTGSTSGPSKNVRDVLAAAASPHPSTGAPSDANSCSGASNVAAENGDGDFFFCAASGSELADTFRTALSQVSNSIRLVQLP